MRLICFLHGYFCVLIVMQILTENILKITQKISTEIIFYANSLEKKITMLSLHCGIAQNFNQSFPGSPLSLKVSISESMTRLYSFISKFIILHNSFLLYNFKTLF